MAYNYLFRQSQNYKNKPDSKESPIEFIERRFVNADGLIEWDEQFKKYLEQKIK